MTPAQWERLKDVFQAALDQPAAGRRDWLRARCGDDRSLAQEAEALLDTHETAGTFLEEGARIDPADLETLPSGTAIGNYVIVEELGRGGMGVVYLAEDTRLGRRVALKSLPFSVANAPELRQRLRREARAAATISHPGVAVVYALEEIDDHLFIVSEYVSGETLRSAIARGPIEPARAGAIASDMASALTAAHDAGVIHRDLKPENVLIKPDGSIKIVDFGIAQIEGPEATRLTRAGAMLGTPAYMAPEQLLGGQVDGRADIYAFGIVLGEMLTGRHPLRTDGAAASAKTPTGPFAAIIARCLQADPAARYANARDLQSAITAQRDAAAPARGIRPPGPPEGGSYDRRPYDRGAYGGDLQADPASPRDLQRPADAGRHGTNGRFWWEFHEAAAALVYTATVIPAWFARGLIGGWQGRTFFIIVLAATIVSVTARLHLWFTSHFYATELAWVYRRSSLWIRIADWAFAIALAAGAILIRDEHSPLAIVLPAVAIGAVVAFVLIEPVTTRDAFRRSGLSDHHVERRP